MKNTKLNVCLDANVLLEALYERKESKKANSVIIKNKESLYISALTAHLIYYYGLKILKIEDLEKFLSGYTILSLEDVDFHWAVVNNRNNDFEDALQLAVAIRNNQSVFYTFDKDLYKNYKDLTIIDIKLL